MGKKYISVLAGALAALLLFAGCTGNASSAQSQNSQSSSAASQASSLPQNPSGIGSGSQPSATGFTLTIPEGYTLPRIGMTLEEMGVCTADEFIQAAQTGDYSAYPYIAAMPYNENRCFTLEGYLFPDTYEFAAGATPQDIIKTMLNNTEKKLAGIQDAIAQSGYSADEVLILASIVEKESFGEDIMAQVSSVLHNRLAIGMQLQTDVTIKYVTGAIQPFIEGDKDRYNEYYNTYKCDALPAGAICNPGMAAILAALAPADTNYLYFVTDQDGNYLFAETYEEHQENVAAAGL